MAPNYSIYAMPVYWLMALWPHIYAVGQIKAANNGKWNNANSRGADTIEGLKKTVPADVFARYERAEAAHKNMVENAALFFGTVVVGNVAGLSNSTLNIAVAAYLVLRAVYIALYIRTSTVRNSWFRTYVWGVSTVLLFGVLIMAGNRVAALKV